MPVIEPTQRSRTLEDGLYAFRQGNMKLACAKLTCVSDDPIAMLPLAEACRTLGDESGARTALEDLLAIQPSNVPALLMSGDMSANGDVRAASAFYQAALAQANANPSAASVSLHAGLRRAQSYLQNAGIDYERYLRDRLNSAGITTTTDLSHISHAIDLLTGKTEIFLQRPSGFYFPGLPQIEFFQRAMFPWLEAIEDVSTQITEELERDRT